MDGEASQEAPEGWGEVCPWVPVLLRESVLMKAPSQARLLRSVNPMLGKSLQLRCLHDRWCQIAALAS